MKKIIFYTIGLIVLGILVSFLYQFAINFTYTRHINLPPQLLASTSTDQTSVYSGPDAFGQKNPSIFDPASSTVDTSSWKLYINNELGYSIKYPSGFSMNTDASSTLILAVPKDKYFHWPLLDDVKITINISTSCPTILAGPLDIKVMNFDANGYSFAFKEGSDVAAGNIYRELAYDFVNNGLCYHLDLFVHGANGAGLYVEGQSFITQYDSQHQNDLDSVLRLFTAIVNSFKIVETPAGLPEDQVSPQ